MAEDVVFDKAALVLDEIVDKNDGKTVPKAIYSSFVEHVQQTWDKDRLCKMFCGGVSCKYCTNSLKRDFAPDDGIKHVYSSWITTNILAMARPQSAKMESLVKEFADNNIRSVINMQSYGEHKYCGCGITESGYSYDPTQFMRANISYYNFCWDDFGTAPYRTIVDTLITMRHALGEGKVAVHCHAGLGRTGLIIACYLIFSTRISGPEAINIIRVKRPKSIQASGQVNSILTFPLYMKRYWTIYPSVESDTAAFTYRLTLAEFLRNQSVYLVGEEIRRFRHLPKILVLLSCILLHTAGVPLPHDQQFQLHEDELARLTEEPVVIQPLSCAGKPASPDHGLTLKKKLVVDAFLQYSDQVDNTVNEVKRLVNSNNDWAERLLLKVCNPRLAVRLLLDWLYELKTPAVDLQYLISLGDSWKGGTGEFPTGSRIDRNIFHLVRLMAGLVVGLRLEASHETAVVEQVRRALTQNVLRTLPRLRPPTQLEALSQRASALMERLFQQMMATIQ